MHTVPNRIAIELQTTTRPSPTIRCFCRHFLGSARSGSSCSWPRPPSRVRYRSAPKGWCGAQSARRRSHCSPGSHSLAAASLSGTCLYIPQNCLRFFSPRAECVEYIVVVWPGHLLCCVFFFFFSSAVTLVDANIMTANPTPEMESEYELVRICNNNRHSLRVRSRSWRFNH